MENKQIDEREIRRDFSTEITPERENDTRNLVEEFKGLSVEIFAKNSIKIAQNST